MRMRAVFIIIACCLGVAPALAQSYRSTVNEANEHYEQKQYDQAKELYEQAAAVEPERAESHFNYGNAAYRTDDIKKALEQYERAGTRLRDRQEIASTLYNAGNTFLKAAEEGKDNPVLQQAAGGQAEDLRMQGYHQAIEMYKKALKLNPSDEDARYNLTYARKKLEELQQQQQNKDQNQDQQKKQQKQDKQQDQDQKDKSKEEEQQKKDQQDQQQQKQQNQKDQQQQEQEKAKPDEQQQSKPKEEQKMSKQQAEQILRALERQEKALQKKKRQKVGVRTSVEKDW